MSQTPSPFTATTYEALEAAVADALQVDKQQLWGSLASILVAHSDQIFGISPEIKSLYDSGTRVLTLLNDRIPAGQEKSAFAAALVLHLGQSVASELIGEAAANEHALVVDGLDDQNCFAGDGQRAPFVVFSVARQENIAGPFASRELAEQQRLSILHGHTPQLDAQALSQALHKAEAASIGTGSTDLQKTFEVTAFGFDGGTDDTDDRVFWVKAASPEEVQSALAGTQAVFRDTIAADEGIDFRLPADAELFKAKLLEFEQVDVNAQASAQDPASALKNVQGQAASTPFYIWANEDCANKSDDFAEAKAIRMLLINDGGESVHITDAGYVEVVDPEIEAHEALAKAGYFAGLRNPDVKPEHPGRFMVNDPQDPNGFAIVGDDMAALIFEARDQLIDPESIASANHAEIENVLSQALPATSGYEKGFKDALESITLALAQKVDVSTLHDAITTALDAYANNAADNGATGQEYRVLGAHPNGNFFDISVKAKDGLSAFGSVALILKDQDIDNVDAQFFAALPAGVEYELPGDSIVEVGTVLDPEQAGVYGLSDLAEEDSCDVGPR